MKKQEDLQATCRRAVEQDPLQLEAHDGKKQTVMTTKEEQRLRPEGT